MLRQWALCLLGGPGPAWRRKSFRASSLEGKCVFRLLTNCTIYIIIIVVQIITRHC